MILESSIPYEDVGAQIAVRFWDRVEGFDDIDSGMEYLLGHVGEWAAKGLWDTVSTLLRHFDPARFHPSVSVAVLSMAEPGKSKVICYGEARDRVRRHFVDVYGESKADDLMVGL